MGASSQSGIPDHYFKFGKLPYWFDFQVLRGVKLLQNRAVYADSLLIVREKRNTLLAICCPTSGGKRFGVAAYWRSVRQMSGRHLYL